MQEERSKNLKIGIIGVGMVGGAVKKYFEKKGIKPFVYDKGKNEGSIEEVNEADVVFVCVPTPYIKDKGPALSSSNGPALSSSNGFDLSYVQETCKNLNPSTISGQGKIVVIKSTIVPGTTEKLQKEFPEHKFLFNPEFLSEATADEDMLNPDRQLIGYTEKSKSIAQEILDILPEAPYQKLLPATEIEVVKYFNNTFNAVKVTFANQMYDLCEKMMISYEDVMEASAKSKFIQTEDHLHIFHGGYRGYGGKCLIKDIRALIQFADLLGVDLRLHKITEEINNKMIEKQGISDPENISKRE